MYLIVRSCCSIFQCTSNYDIKQFLHSTLQWRRKQIENGGGRLDKLKKTGLRLRLCMQNKWGEGPLTSPPRSDADALFLTLPSEYNTRKAFSRMSDRSIVRKYFHHLKNIIQSSIYYKSNLRPNVRQVN